MDGMVEPEGVTLGVAVAEQVQMGIMVERLHLPVMVVLANLH
jgi:hypothetical protein